ncbi:hypothetical protein Tco_0716218 [Tanacetum coccineum]
MLRESLDFSEESVEKSWGKESANESESKFIPSFNSSFVEFIQLYSEEFMNVSMRISFGSTIKLVFFDKSQVVTFNSKFVRGFRNSDCGTGSRSDNTVNNLHGFIIHETEISKDNEKVTEVFDVENWRIDNSWFLRWVVSLIECNYFVDEVFDSEYAQVQVMVQQVQNWKHVYASKGEFVWGQFVRKLYNVF